MGLSFGEHAVIIAKGGGHVSGGHASEAGHVSETGHGSEGGHGSEEHILEESADEGQTAEKTAPATSTMHVPRFFFGGPLYWGEHDFPDCGSGHYIAVRCR